MHRHQQNKVGASTVVVTEVPVWLDVVVDTAVVVVPVRVGAAEVGELVRTPEVVLLVLLVVGAFVDFAAAAGASLPVVLLVVRHGHPETTPWRTRPARAASTAPLTKHMSVSPGRPRTEPHVHAPQPMKSSQASRHRAALVTSTSAMISPVPYSTPSSCARQSTWLDAASGVAVGAASTEPGLAASAAATISRLSSSLMALTLNEEHDNPEITPSLGILLSALASRAFKKQKSVNPGTSRMSPHAHASQRGSASHVSRHAPGLGMPSSWPTCLSEM
mmetsp:Transcript_69192/g.196136  ORF Transcript_69192/g.196136 Transcript_69192/m.196136 type:complete len:276 (+) Transcript_69192:753-1580(+)